MFDPRITAIRIEIDADEAGVQAAIEESPAPSGWLGPLRDTYAAHRALLTLAEEYSPSLSEGDDGEGVLGDVVSILADLYNVRRPYRGDRSGWTSDRRELAEVSTPLEGTTDAAQ